MTLLVLETSLPPDPLRLARRIWGRAHPMLLWSRDGSGPSYLACDPCAESHELDPEPELELRDRGPWGRVPRWVGILPYEAERARLERPAWSVAERRAEPLFSRRHWWKYPAVAVVESVSNEPGSSGPSAAAPRVILVGESAEALSRLHEALSSPELPSSEVAAETWGPGEPKHVHRERIERALAHIVEGDVYQVNLSRLLEVRLRGPALAVLEQMSQRAPSPYAAALAVPDGGEVISTSPELFLRLTPDRGLLTIPIKGTRPRHGDVERDRRALADLASDPKEAAELSMVIDVERNDLGRVSEVGSVRTEPAFVRPVGAVFHRQAHVTGTLCSGVGRRALLEAMLPSGSVTGAPKVRAMELIAELERARRGLYTGAFGCLTQDGGLELAMAIRTLCRRGEVGHYHVGGGIVADSDPEREVEETTWKAAQLLGLLSSGQ